MRVIAPLDRRWLPTINGQTLVAGQRYTLNPAHTVELVAMPDGAEIELRPGGGQLWSALTTQITYPSGWTLQAGPGVNASQPARLIVDATATTFTIYA